MEEGMINNGGLQYVPQLAITQIVYLDFDGELTSYNGEILTLDTVEVKDSLLTAERINNIVTSLNEKHAAQGIQFVTQRPVTADYSTIFVGKTAAFDQYGAFAGLAETIDKGNINKSDNAFVLLNAADTDEAIIATIAHEVSHLTGTLDHGGSGLGAYADEINISSGVTSNGMTIKDGDSVTVDNGGYLNNATVNRATLSVSSGGRINNTQINAGGSALLYTGGVADITTVNSGASVILSGGSANNTTIRRGGLMLAALGSANNTTVLISGALHVSSGTVNRTQINASWHWDKGERFSSGGSMYISNGGVASNTTVSGYLYVYSGGIAERTSVGCFGSMSLESGASANIVTVNSSGSLHASNGASVNQVTVNSSGLVHFSSGVSADKVTVNFDGLLYISSGTSVNSLTVNSSGHVYISAGATASDVIWTPGQGHVSAADGASVTYASKYEGVYIASNGSLTAHHSATKGEKIKADHGGRSAYVFSNGVMEETLVCKGYYTTYGQCEVYVYAGGVIRNTSAYITSGDPGAYLHTFSGGFADTVTLDRGGVLNIFSGGSADNVTVNASGYVYISSGGTATNIIWTPCVGEVSAADGAHVTYTSQYNGVYFGENDQLISSGTILANKNFYTPTWVNDYATNEMYVMAGGSALSTNVRFGKMTVCSAGGALDTTVGSSGTLRVSNGGKASRTTLNGGAAALHVYSGGVASETNIANGAMYVSSGGSADTVTVDGGDNLYVCDGAKVSNITVKTGGSAHIYAGGSASNISITGTDNTRTEMNLGGTAEQAKIGNNTYFHVSSGAMIIDTTVQKNGTLFVSAGATVKGSLDLGGKMNLEGGVSFVDAAINFNLDGSNAYQGISIDQMTEELADVTFSITVSDLQATGIYELVKSGVTDFTGTITVSTGTAELGTVSVGGSKIQAGDYFFSLSVDSGKLNFIVKVNELTAPTVTASTAAPTNKDVILTVSFSDKSTANEYRIDGGSWQTCSDSVITVTQNALYEFRSQNVDGSYSAVTAYTVDNIDKIAPVITVTRSTTATATQVTLTAAVQGGSNLQYSYDGKNWSSYTEPLLLFRSSTVYFKASDEAGNVTTEPIEVDNVKQEAPFVTADTTALTNGNVTLTVYFRPEGVKQEYSTDNVTWQSCSETLEVTANGTFYFRDTDADGNVSQVTTYTVANIDKTAPDAPDAIELIYSTEALLLDWNDVKDKGTAGIKGYYFRYGTSVNLTGEGEFTDTSIVNLPILQSGQWYFQVKSIDAAGNESGWSEVLSAVVDSDAPVITLKTCADRPVAGTYIQATVDDGSPLYYSTDGVTYAEYTGVISVFANGTWYFKAVDESGNTTIESVTLNNIDTTLPNVLTAAASITEPTKANVRVSADFTGFAATRQWSQDGVKWRNYTAPLTVHSNVTLYFREIDIFGNVSDVITYTVSNIDKTAPDAPGWMEFTAAGSSVTVDWDNAADNGTAGIAGYNFRYGSSETLTGEGEFVDTSIIDVAGLETGIWYFQVQSVDGAGNVSAWSEVYSFTVALPCPTDLQGDADGLSWASVDGALGYEVEYSTDGFATAVTLVTATCAIDSYALPEGAFQWRVRTINGSDWVYGEEIVLTAREDAEVLTSDADKDTDVFFGNAIAVWEARYAAQHLGNGTWNGTREQVLLEGKNRIADLFEGSRDANILVLTDDANGDALFVDDIYTALGDQARFAQIDEIRAGAGDDIVDMTSQRYAYNGSEIEIHGGSGNDTLWGGAEKNVLFGDAGNDRLVGASGNDILAGGSGNDRMHGGGGDDIFTFGGAFGNDTVEQLASGSVTLWFADGSEDNWDAETLTYSDGTNTVSVSGSVNVTLRFGADADLPAGSFEEEMTRKVFEDKGMLA